MEFKTEKIVDRKLKIENFRPIAVFVYGQHLNPQIEVHWRLSRLEFHAFGFFTLHYSHGDCSHRRHIDRHTVTVKRKLLYLVARQAVTYTSQIAQVADVAVDRRLRIGNLLYFAFKIRHLFRVFGGCDGIAA